MKTPPTGATDIRECVRASLADMHVRDAKIVVAISGGTDSSALLLLLSELRLDAGLHLVAAHFDHQLRDPSEHAADRAFVEQLCSRLHVAIVFGEGDVRAHAKACGQSIEHAARNLRYEFLRSVASEHGAALVAVGHTADDQVETIVHRIIRGTGIEGL
ncbi:MAG: tRNA lysidine(34) synthetase TilS, partial [Chloroflexota bacterium]